MAVDWVRWRPVGVCGDEAVVTDAQRIGDGVSEVCNAFIRDVNAIPAPDVIEFGTRRAEESTATHHKEWVPLAATYTMVDVEDGTDVDWVRDIHDDFRDGHEPWDALIAVSVAEHLQRPWVAAQRIADALRPGGIAYLSTHHTFPLHNYGPTGEGDYFRFSRSALELLFTDAGMETVASGYLYPCEIIPPLDVQMGRWNPGAPAWLVTDIYARKP